MSAVTLQGAGAGRVGQRGDHRRVEARRGRRVVKPTSRWSRSRARRPPSRSPRPAPGGCGKILRKTGRDGAIGEVIAEIDGAARERGGRGRRRAGDSAEPAPAGPRRSRQATQRRRGRGAAPSGAQGRWRRRDLRPATCRAAGAAGRISQAGRRARRRGARRRVTAPSRRGAPEPVELPRGRARVRPDGGRASGWCRCRRCGGRSRGGWSRPSRTRPSSPPSTRST